MNVLLINFVLIIILILLIYVYLDDKSKIKEGAWWTRLYYYPGLWRNRPICGSDENYCNNNDNCKNANCSRAGNIYWTQTDDGENAWDYGGGWWACRCVTNYCHAGYKIRNDTDTKSDWQRCNNNTPCESCPEGEWASKHVAWRDGRKIYGNDTTSCNSHESCGRQVSGSSRLTGASKTTKGTCANCTQGTFASHGWKDCKRHTTCTSAKYQTRAPTHQLDRVCATKTCTCTGGSGASGAACPKHNTAKCVSCTGKKFLSGTECKDWKVCQKGQKVSQNPSNTQDRICVPCEAGTFSDEENASSCTSASIGNFVSNPGQENETACPHGSYSISAGANTCEPHPGYEITSSENGTIGAKQLNDYDERVTFKDSGDITYKMFKFVQNSDLGKANVDAECTEGQKKITNGFGLSYCIEVNNQYEPGNKFFANPDGYLSENSFSYKGGLSICPEGYKGNILRNQCILKDWASQEEHPLEKVECKNVSFSNAITIKTNNEATFDISCNPGYFGGGKFKCEYGVIKPLTHSPGETSKDCKPCPPGTFQDLSGQYTCRKCIPGTFQANLGQTDCSKCSIDNYQAESGQPSCNPCDPELLYQDISGSKSCKTFCRPDNTGYTQISGPKYTGKLSYGLYEMENSDGRNTFHICDISGGFNKITDTELYKYYDYSCNEGHYKCGDLSEKKHLNTNKKYNGTKNNFVDNCCSKFPTDETFSYLNSASCKLTGTMDLESGHNKLNADNFIKFYTDGRDVKYDLFSIENQQKWNKFKSTDNNSNNTSSNSNNNS